MYLLITASLSLKTQDHSKACQHPGGPKLRWATHSTSRTLSFWAFSSLVTFSLFLFSHQPYSHTPDSCQHLQKPASEIANSQIPSNCEGSDILPYLKVNKLAWHSFMDAGRKTQESRVRDEGQFIIHSNSISWSISNFLLVSWVPFPMKIAKWPLHTQWISLLKRNVELREPESFNNE